MGYRYLGNKTRLADQIVSTVSRSVAPGARIADPMCGTASVSEAFALAGYKVTASDELTFPTIHARVRLMCPSPPAFAALGGYESAIRQLNELKPSEGFFHREYGASGQPATRSQARKYFTARNAGLIDSMRSQLLAWQGSGQLDEHETALLLHDLILAVNTVANIAGTYGYFRSELSASARREMTLTKTGFKPVGSGHIVLQGRVEDLAATLDADACYLDPPYTKRQYAGNYHILETLAVQDEPEPVGDGGLRDWYDQYSDFCSKRYVLDAFNEVIKRLDVAHIFVSYSEDGLLAEKDLQELLSSRGRVLRHEFSFQRYRSNSGGKGGRVAEHLYHVEVV